MWRSRTKSVLFLVTIAVVLAGAGYAVHTALRFLSFEMVSSEGPDFQRSFTNAFAVAVHIEHPRVRISPKITSTAEAARKAFEAGEGDLIVARADTAPGNGLAIAILRRDLLFFLEPHWRKSDSIGGIRNARIGVLGADPRDEALLRLVLDYYAARPASIGFVAPEEVGPMIHGRKIDALFVVAPATSPAIDKAYDAIRKASDGAPKLLMIDEADAIARRNPVLEASDVSKGAMIGAPSVPDDDSNTLSVSARLLAHDRMPNVVAAEIARILFKDRARIANQLPPTTAIEAPDTDTLNAALPLHPGAYAFLTGNQPSLSDEAQNTLYWVGLVASGIGSLGALALAAARRFRTPPLENDIKRLLDIWGDCALADADALIKFEKEVDTIIHDVLRRQASGADPTLDQSFPLVVAQVRLALDRRRKALLLDDRADGVVLPQSPRASVDRRADQSAER